MRTLWKITKLLLAGALTLVVVAIVACLGYRWYRHAAIARATAIDPSRGIDEELFARIGGVEQWIAIRGQNRDNPVVLFVHGGPGIAVSPYPRDVLFSWTRDFTIVFWDQRGAGKTFSRSGPVGSSVTVDGMVEDGVEVAEFARARLHKRKVVLLGLSSGSMLGVHMAKARPDLFYAYVGTGQSINQRKYKVVAYEELLEEARARNDRRAVAELTANGPPPYASVSRAAVHTKWANAYEPGQPSAAALASMILFDSTAGPLDVRDYVRGIMTSEDHFRDIGDAEDLPLLGTDFAIPFFVFQGARDHVTPVRPVREYMNTIKAPSRELVLIPNAGHNAMVTRSDEFLKLLVEKVRPLAK